MALWNTTFSHFLNPFLLFASLIHSIQLFLHRTLLPLGCSSLGCFCLFGSCWLTCEIWCKSALFCLFLVFIVLFSLISLINLSLTLIVESFIRRCRCRSRNLNISFTSRKLRSKCALLKFSSILSLFSIIFPARGSLSLLRGEPVECANLWLLVLILIQLILLLVLLLLLIWLLLGIEAVLAPDGFGFLRHLLSSVSCREFVSLGT